MDFLGQLKRLRKSAFTLVEIMIVVAIIALLATIAIPNILRARMQGNEAVAKKTLGEFASVLEQYNLINGVYPTSVDVLTTAVPQWYPANIFDDVVRGGYIYTILGGGNLLVSGYTIQTAPNECGTSGTKIYTITTGLVLTEADCN